MKEDREAKQHLAWMDINNNNKRAQTAAKIIRWLSDVALDSTSDNGEEFIGFDEVSLTSADESEAEDLEVH